MNGEIIEDVFDYHFQTNDTYLELTIRKKDGEEWDLEIEKEYDEEIGITFENEFMEMCIRDSGSSGNKVLQMQEQLNVIAEVYSSIPTVYENGYFDEETQDAVEAFQRLLGLPVSGIGDYPTWYKIQSIYVAVTRIAELQ